MQTQIISVDQISLALKALRLFHPVAFPTETVYGLGAPISSDPTIEAIFSLKKRAKDNPLIVHISSLDQMDAISKDLPPSFFILARRFWPGPLTLIVPKKEVLSSLISPALSTVAVRMPSHPVALDWISAVGEPLVAPSANLSGRPSPTQASHVLEDFEGAIPYILDGGPSFFGIESTVLNLVGPLTLMRPGAIALEELEEALGESIFLPNEKTQIASPGMKYRHYAPRGELFLISSFEEKKEGDYLIDDISSHNLYAKLRQADALGAEKIALLCDEKVKQNRALMDRILRASQT